LEEKGITADRTSSDRNIFSFSLKTKRIYTQNSIAVLIQISNKIGSTGKKNNSTREGVTPPGVFHQEKTIELPVRENSKTVVFLASEGIF